MTEDEAKTKWCPHTGIIPTFEPRNQMSGARCIASACMAWRWTGYRTETGAWVRKSASGPWDPSKADGFCGLAGRPA